MLRRAVLCVNAKPLAHPAQWRLQERMRQGGVQSYISHGGRSECRNRSTRKFRGVELMGARDEAAEVVAGDCLSARHVENSGEVVRGQLKNCPRQIVCPYWAAILIGEEVSGAAASGEIEDEARLRIKRFAADDERCADNGSPWRNGADRRLRRGLG